jgi:hypothetical protein
MRLHIFRRFIIICMQINPIQYFILFLFLLLLNSCITEFIPKSEGEKELLVVEGLITDQTEHYTIKLSKSLPLGEISAARPVSGCSVQISDNAGNNFSLKETVAGTYITDSTIFKGVIGRTYTLHIGISNGNNIISYQSFPAEMKPVPSIDSVYYEKTVIEKAYENFQGIDGCQIYLDTHDDENNCKFYRWDYTETWEINLPFEIQNKICWISDNSDTINIKSTAAFKEARINRHPVTFISNVTDRLKTKYSILVNQYSLNEDEFNYWQELQKLMVQVGGLSDIIPSSIPSNIWCPDNPNEKVLGYFSVSAKSSERIFVKDNFAGIIDPYANCVTAIGYSFSSEGFNVTWWVLIANVCSFPCITNYEITTHKECTDCTFRGTTTKPFFWMDDK